MQEPGAGQRYCAVIYNPTKVTDDFQERVAARLSVDGWREPMWLVTSADDPGRSMTAKAVEAGVDLVIAAGGDGTIRIVADGLAGTGIPMGIVPAGTGNLLARNLQLPLDETAALDVAVGGQGQPIDLVRLTVDDGRSEHFAVMAGVGMDAVIMDEVNPTLKKNIGSAAYFLAAGKALGRLPMRLDVRVDGRRPRRRQAMLCVIGNVGDLQGNITLIPGAKADDGRLHVYLASPHTFKHWLLVALRLITRRGRSDDPVDQWDGSRVEVRLHGRENYQLDGDVVGECTRMIAEVRPGALTVCLPAPASAPLGESRTASSAG